MQYFLDKLKEFLVFLVFSRLCKESLGPCNLIKKVTVR